MALKNYNNNDKGPMVSTYSNITFSNPESKIMASKFSISYLNKVMKITIALRNNTGSNDDYATYDSDNPAIIYLSNVKAELLRQMIIKMRSDPSIHNVCAESKYGLLKISDGIEYGVQNPCISISFADEAGNVTEVVYETKSHISAYNYSNGEFSTETFNNIELDTIIMAFEEYYKASSYAIAASIAESSMYRREAQNNLIKAIAEKVGAHTSPSKQYNNKTFLSTNNNKTSSTSSGLTGVPAGYEVASFDSIANGM